MGVENLKREGILEERIVRTGDVMYDSFLFTKEHLEVDKIIEGYGLRKNDFVLATLHRPENVDFKDNLKQIILGLNESPKEVFLPIHPRTRKMLESFDLWKLITKSKTITPSKPIGYCDFIALELSAWKIVTDSGGVQKEAYMASVPCITTRNETEWIETVQSGWNVLVGNERKKIAYHLVEFSRPEEHLDLFGNGRTSEFISDHLKELEEKGIKI